MISYFSLIVAIVGLIGYIASSHPKLVEVCRIMFFCGLLVFLLSTGARTVSLFR